ncbi:MAG: MOSC domain-containing protein [Haloferacaceae archaeon]
MGHVARLTVYPVKGLDGQRIDAARILPGGTLEHDREFALFDADGETFNGKQTDRIHRLDTDYDAETGRFRVETTGGDVREFDLDAERERASAWFSEFFGADLDLRRDGELGYVDRRGMGPSVISTATVETVASWFDDLTPHGVRRRLRANVEVGGVPAFWEDRFVGDDAPAFAAGGVRFEGAEPCARCVVPERDPDTGERTAGFRERFVERRRETFPEWADRDAFDHLYTLMLIARIPEADRGKTVRVDEPVEVV